MPLLLSGSRGADRARHRCRHPAGGALARATRTTPSSWPEQIRSPSCRPRTDEILRGTREIFAHLREREPWRFAAAHRRRFADHRDARESDAAGKLLEYFREADDLESREPRAAPAGDAEVVNVPEAHRYELLLDGERIGELAYRQRNDRIAFTHTNVNPRTRAGDSAAASPKPRWTTRAVRGWPSSPSVPSSPGTSSNTPNMGTWSRRTTQAGATSRHAGSRGHSRQPVDAGRVGEHDPPGVI